MFRNPRALGNLCICTCAIHEDVFRHVSKCGLSKPWLRLVLDMCGLGHTDWCRCLRGNTGTVTTILPFVTDDKRKEENNLKRRVRDGEQNVFDSFLLQYFACQYCSWTSHSKSTGVKRCCSNSLESSPMAFHKIVEPVCHNLLPFSHNSLSKVGHGRWATRPVSGFYHAKLFIEHYCQTYCMLKNTFFCHNCY